MDALPIAQQIKIIKGAGLKVPVYRAPTEDYNPDRPTQFDRHVHMEVVKVNVTIGFLLRTIEFLSKELMLSGRALPPSTWRRLASIRDLIRDQRHTQQR